VTADTQKLLLSQRWKHRRASRPIAPAPAPVPAPTPVVDEALTPVKRTLIARWVAARIVTWLPDRCFHCKGPIIYGAKWVDVVSDKGRARFHADCLPVWKVQQEAAARRALGMNL
jgi:hypothetical protein